MEHLKKVTLVSKTLAVVSFVCVVFVVFCIGRIYQINNSTNVEEVTISKSKIETVSPKAESQIILPKEAIYIDKELGVEVKLTNINYTSPILTKNGNRLTSGGLSGFNYIDVYKKEKNQTLVDAVDEQIVININNSNCKAVQNPQKPNSVFVIDKRLNITSVDGSDVVDGMMAGSPFIFDQENLQKYAKLENFCYPKYDLGFYEDQKNKTYFYYYQYETQALPEAKLEIKAL